MEVTVTPRVPELKAGARRKRSQEDLGVEMRWNALLGQHELLREEIRRGKECLKSTQAELAESRLQLEEWPAYEKRCGERSLPGLTESVMANRRMERFLTGWLKRREHRLAAATDAIDRFARENDLLHLLEEA
jgi:hypothetical protein